MCVTTSAPPATAAMSDYIHGNTNNNAQTVITRKSIQFPLITTCLALDKHWFSKDDEVGVMKVDVARPHYINSEKLHMTLCSSRLRGVMRAAVKETVVH